MAQQRQTAFLHGLLTAGTAEFHFQQAGQLGCHWVSGETGCW